MLSSLLKPMDENEVDIKKYIMKLSQNIIIQSEKNDIIKIIFSKSQRHTVKCIQFDFNWIIKPEFKIVEDALIKLSSIITLLKTCKFKDNYSICIVQHMIFLNKILKEGLITYGCLKPPYIIELTTNKDTILEIANQVDKYLLVHSKPINITI